MESRLNRFAPFVALTIVFVMLAGCGVNAIPTKQERARAAWADVQSQYQRRSNLIPNLVATVQGYANHERDVLVQVTEARASATQIHVDASTANNPAALQQYEAAQNQLSGALGRLIAISENYPQLRASDNFMALQSQLEGTENRIAVARRDYNDAVRDYNTELRTFPGVMWKGVFYHDAQPMAPFAAEASAQTAPTVNFPRETTTTQPAPAPH